MNRSVELKVLDPRLAQWGLPRYQSAGAAAVDLHACIDAALVLQPGQDAVLVPAGFAMHLNDPELAALILPRSGSAHRRGLVLGNGTGLIDADYTGPILVSVWNRSARLLTIEPGERIAQMLFVPAARVVFKAVEAFSVGSVRGAGGFGSTG